jgi:hypothetical protein
MNLRRRDFIKTTLTASAATAVSASALKAAAAPAGASREFYELRAYTLIVGAPTAPLEGYLEKTLLPALATRGVRNVGAFTEVTVDKRAVTSTPKADSPLWVLIPYASFDSFVAVSAELNADPAVQQSGADYLGVPKATPAFDRVDTWLYRAFKGQPQLELAAFSKNKTPTRIFEMRDYESHSEKAALLKMKMFDEGEISLMKDLGMAPTFFAQAIAGPNLPHLRYFTSGSDLAAHLAAWAKFGPDPRWQAMAKDVQYKDTVSKNTARFLVPRPYSQI